MNDGLNSALDLTLEDLAGLRKAMEDVAGQWNGDESGLGEDRSACAKEIIEKAEELESLIREMQDYL